MLYIAIIFLAFLIDASLIHTSGHVFGVSVLIWQVFFLIFLVLQSKKSNIYQHFNTHDTVNTKIHILLKKNKYSMSFIGVALMTLILAVWFIIFTNAFFTNTFLILLIILDIILIVLLFHSEIVFGLFPSKDMSLIGRAMSHIFTNLDSGKKRIKQDIDAHVDFKAPNASFFKAFYILILILCLIFPLLLSSDAVFRSLIMDLFSSVFGGLDIIEGIPRFLVILFIAWILLTLITALRVFQYTVDDIHMPIFTIDKVYNYIILGGMNCVYLLFVIIQFRYTWFMDQENFPNTGITYSEYIHSGFYQLIVVTIINYLAYRYFYQKTHTRESAKIRINLVVLLILTMMIAYSAFSRIVLYIEAYHLTTLRIFVVYLIVCIFVLLFLNLLNLYRENKGYPGIFILFVLGSFIGLGYSNIDGMIARYNISHAQSDFSDLDIPYILSLSDDAIDERIQIIENKENRSIVLQELHKRGVSIMREDVGAEKSDLSMFHYNFFREKFLGYIREHILPTMGDTRHTVVVPPIDSPTVDTPPTDPNIDLPIDTLQQ